MLQENRDKVENSLLKYKNNYIGLAEAVQRISEILSESRRNELQSQYYNFCRFLESVGISYTVEAYSKTTSVIIQTSNNYRLNGYLSQYLNSPLASIDIDNFAFEIIFSKDEKFQLFQIYHSDQLNEILKQRAEDENY